MTSFATAQSREQSNLISPCETLDNIRVAVLCASRNSIYKQFPNVEVYDEIRDAWTYTGGLPVITHAPCRSWSAFLSWCAKPAPRERELAFFCLDQVRRWGGVFEHPCYSRFWDAAGIPKPQEPHDEYGGYTIMIWQWWFRYTCIKRTWLYVVGLPISELPEIPFRLLDSSYARVEKLPAEERSRTTRELADWLLCVARKAWVRKHGYAQ